MQEKSKTSNTKYNLRKQTFFANRPIRTHKYSIESVVYLTLKIWTLVPNEIKKTVFRDFWKKHNNLEHF